MEFRKIFDTIPEQFDQYRPRYCQALFEDLIAFAKLTPDKAVLEIGPGTGQATDPILNTGCQYKAIELGENMCEMMKHKYGQNPNFTIINDDFITYDFGDEQFDMIYSSATIQWIPTEIAYSKTFQLLKPGGTLAMMLTRDDYRTPNEALYQEIQKVYAAFFKPEFQYTHYSFPYTGAPEYGYTKVEQREYHGKRVFTADEYAAYCGTHCTHLVIPEPFKTHFFDGLKDAVRQAGNQIVFHDTYVLYLTKKPE